MSEDEVVTGGLQRPLYVAGVVGGAGTSTLVRILNAWHNPPDSPQHNEIRDLGVFHPDHLRGPVDLLVSSNTGAASARLPYVVAMQPRPPVLVVMRTALGRVPVFEAILKVTKGNLTRLFELEHRRKWIELDFAPGREVDSAVTLVMGKLPAAITEMWAAEPRKHPQTAAPRLAQTRAIPAPVAAAFPVTARAGPQPVRWSNNGAPPPVAHRASPRG